MLANVFRKLITTLLLLAITSLSQAQEYEKLEMDMESGNTLIGNRFPAEGESLIIWVPSERGIQPPSIPLSLNIALSGIDVWALDLHGSYLVPPTRRSFEEFDPADLQELLDMAVAEGFERIMFLSSGRGAAFVLEVARSWRQRNPESKALVGFSFFHPHLLDGRPDMGESAQYLPIAHANNLPVYLIQPEYSTKYARTEEIAQVLAEGGAKVFVHKLKGVTAGFHARPDEDLKPIDFKTRDRLPTLFASIMNVMSDMPYPKDIAPLPDERSAKAEQQPGFREPRLHPFKGDPIHPKTQLTTLDGDSFDLVSTRGEVVLVNFWATWCGPCVEEIPSLRRLVSRMEGKPFRVVAVNIGEPREVIDEFLKEIKVNFPVLLDTSSATVRDWKVYAYPSNYLLDKQGRIRYAYRGALEWDSANIVKTIEDTLAE